MLCKYEKQLCSVYVLKVFASSTVTTTQTVAYCVSFMTGSCSISKRAIRRAADAGVAEAVCSFVHAELQHRCSVGDVAIMVDKHFPSRIEYAVKMVCERSSSDGGGQSEKYLSGDEGFPPCVYDGIEYTYSVLDAIHHVTGVRPEHNVAYGPLVTGWRFSE